MSSDWITEGVSTRVQSNDLSPARQDGSVPVRFTADRRAEFDAAVGREVDANKRAPNTKAAMSQDWRAWSEFCADVEVNPFEVSSGLLVLFAQWLAAGDTSTGRKPSAPSTIKRRFSGVLAGWKAEGFDVPYGVTSDALSALHIYERDLAQANEKRGRGQAPAMTMRQLRELVAVCDPSTMAGKRDRALILLGFSIGARRSELADLAVGDIATDDEHGIVVNLRHSKVGAREAAVPRGQNLNTCPVRAWHTWRQAAELEDDQGAVFRRLRKNGALVAEPDRYGRPGGMTAHAVGQIITRVSQRAGIPGVRLTGHSLRSGMATEARRAGHDMLTIAQQGGWKPGSAELYRYTRIVDRWADNALIGIGL